jgi:lysophospholipase L1-like esterase
VRLKDILLLGALTTATACGSKSAGPVVVQPTPVPDAPVLSCPDDVTVIAHNGQTPTVSFDTPAALLGAPPIAVVCTPASGTKFESGTTVVTCEATDSLKRRAGCNFSVIVTPIPQLLKATTTFLTFGDSLTEGKTSLIGPGAVVVPPGVFNTSVSYVEKLNAKLVARYQDQSIAIIADGLGGEDAGAGKLRLQRDWPSFNPDALLLLEGVNDLLKPETATPAGMTGAMNSVIDALRTDIEFAKGRGARVFVATLLPMAPPVASNVIAALPTLNGRINSLAVQENITLVDLYSAVPLTLLGADGLHPKPGAYDLVADEWLKAIIATMEAKTSALP